MNKKLLLIFATLFLVFTVFFVSAYCCEKTLNGGICQDDIEDNCNNSFLSSSTSCESTSYCKLGTCVNSDIGTCSPNTPRVKCEESGGHWENKSIEEVPQCQLGGCFLGNDCTFVTQTKCELLSSEYGLTTDFMSNIDTWEKCDRLSNPDVEGACVFEEGYDRKCVRTTKKEYYDNYKSNPNYENVDFHENYLCTHEDLNTICGMNDETTCEDGRVHYEDTCGNLANVYDYNNEDEPDYWNEIIKPKNSCELEWNDNLGKFTNADICGNCDYLEGSVCKAEQMGVKNEAKSGDNVCADLSCKYGVDTYRNGERWCYSNAVEGQEDSPGAEYAVLSCIDSEVISEPCDAFRQEICIEEVTNNYHSAKCGENYWKDCSDFETEDECLNSDKKRDCQWTDVDWYDPSDHDDALEVEIVATPPQILEDFVEVDVLSKEDFLGEGYCSPKNSTGFEDIEDAEKTCSDNSYTCELTWVTIGIGDVSRFNKEAIPYQLSDPYTFLEKGFECVEKVNSENIDYSSEPWVAGWRIREEWVEEMGKRCQLAGDCGYSINYLGEEGFQSWPWDLIKRELIEAGDYIWQESDVTWGSFFRALSNPASNLLKLKKTHETITFNCEPWQAPRGGEDCELCNNQELPCTEYQCHALGQGCATMKNNDGETICYHKDRDDATPPQITLIDDLPDDFEYDNEDFIWPDNTISFPNSDRENGVKLIHPEPAEDNIESGDDCLPYNKEFDITIHTDEPANCKYHYNRTSPSADADIEEVFDHMMDKKFNQHSGDMYNHTAQFKLMNREVEETIYNFTIKPDKDYSIFIRCMDGNGNANMNEFEIKFCIDDSPDVEAPYIEEYEIEDGSYITYDSTWVETDFTLDDASPPVACKWDTMERTYEDMINEMECEGYTCTANFTGIVSNDPTEENKFYISCRDLFNNTMGEPVEYSLFGSLPLGIRSAEPNNTKISGASDEVELTLEVETFGGAENGKADCYFDGTKFHETNSNTHSQPGYKAGVDNHTIEIKCVDAGGNMAIENISFEVEQDTKEPIVTRAFKQSGYLRLITNEPAKCVYSTIDCSYGFSNPDITNISTVFKTEHNIAWDPDKDFYIKCKDKYDNQPENPGDCTITIKPSVTFD